MQRNILIGLLLIAGVFFTGSVLLMSPKGGLGMGIGGASGAGDYGSKKSVEGALKKTALISLIVFMFAVLMLPYAS